MLLLRSVAELLMYSMAWPTQGRWGDLRKLLPALPCTKIVLARLKRQEGMAFVCTLILQHHGQGQPNVLQKRPPKSCETRGLIWRLPFSGDDHVTLEITPALVKASESKPLPNLCIP